MAVFGHSGSQAPQLMHSLVMTVAIRRAIPSRRRRVQIASGSPGSSVKGEGDPAPEEEEGLMRRLASAVATGLVFAAGVACAQEHPEMEAARKDLESAKAHLQAAAKDYGGHRKQAVGDIDRALGQIKEGLATVEKKEQKIEHKEQKLERKDTRTQHKLENLKAKEQQMQQK